MATWSYCPECGARFTFDDIHQAEAMREHYKKLDDIGIGYNARQKALDDIVDNSEVCDCEN